MIRIGANGSKIAYGVKHYNLDTEEDIKQLPARGQIMGTTCFIISTSKYYIVNGSYEWVEISPFGNASSGGNGGGGGSSNKDIIYDGGTI